MTVGVPGTRLPAVSSESPGEMTTAAEAAATLGVSEAFVARLIATGRLRASLHGRDHYVAVKDLAAYDEARRARLLAVKTIAETDASLGIDFH